MNFKHSPLLITVALGLAPLSSSAATSALLGWNNLGMHCMDSDYSVFSILPPYNTIEAQLIMNGALVKTGTGYSITYEAVADPSGSINTTSIGKTNFYTFTGSMYGALAVDAGLAGWAMPGATNTPQLMRFETNNSPAAGVTTAVNWFRAEGIPITPFDDAKLKNEYPVMRLVARDSANRVLATSDVVLPVSDEMDCRACHGSGTQADAKPLVGWVADPNPERDYRLNILRLHDEFQFQLHSSQYAAALAARGLNPAGLYANVVNDHRPILCASCHASEALPGTGMAGIPPLTASIHTLHADVMDPDLHVTLNNAANRTGCYRCHPGAATQCLRGAMGKAIAADGTQAMQCQSCHGNMNQVGSSSRVGWFQEPNCQSCHTGTAVQNNGQIRYTSAFVDAIGTPRVAVNQTFATTPDTPAAGLSLYRFSHGHGGLQCSACHGSTHAEFPSSFQNDNLASQARQGHIGVAIECTSCHTSTPNSVTGGPHGMHPVGPSWVSQHHDVAQNNPAACQVCHGTDYRGTVLSVMQANRTLSGQVLFRGAIVGCYMCHNGPSGDGNPGAAPTATSLSASTTIGRPVAMTLPATGTNLLLRIISQPTHGTTGLSNNVATYFPEADFVGTDTFTFAAYNGARNSALATATITVGGTLPAAPLFTTQPASQTVTAGNNVTFTVAATGTSPLAYQWRFGGINLAGATSSALTLNAVTAANAGTYTAVVSNVAGSVTSNSATLTVTPPPVPPTIPTQPVSRTVTAGADVTLTVVASGTAPLSYQWQLNAVNIYGATNATLALGAVSAANSGSYTVVVSNDAGSLTSSPAMLTVNPPPVPPAITTQPVSQTITAGGNVLFTVTASGTAPLSYQWQRNGTDLPGATNVDLILNALSVANAGAYTVVVSNSVGTVTSSAASLSINSATVSIAITRPSDGDRFQEGARIRIDALTVGAGSGARVQFYANSDLVGTDTSAPFTVTTQRMGSGSYLLTAKVTTAAGVTITSAPVRIRVRSGD